MSDAIELADGIVESLNDTEFDPPFMAQRGYLPRFDLEELDDRIVVTVVPGGDVQSGLSRKSDQYLFTTEIGVMCRFPGQAGPGNEQLDPLMKLMQAIRDHLRHTATRIETENLSAVWTGVEVSYSDDHLERLNQFTALIKVQHRIFR